MDGWKRYFPPDVMPGLWTKIEELIDNAELCASEEVLYELEKKEDEVYEWAKNHSELFITTDEELQREVTTILRNHRKLIDARKNRSGADPFVIAVAKIKKCKLVTGENPTYSTSRPNIPDVCRIIGIECINLIDLCREQKWVF